MLDQFVILDIRFFVAPASPCDSNMYVKDRQKKDNHNMSKYLYIPISYIFAAAKLKGFHFLLQQSVDKAGVNFYYFVLCIELWIVLAMILPWTLSDLDYFQNGCVCLHSIF